MSLLFALSLFPMAAAGDDAARDAEVFRLRQEMSMLAQRGAWSGVSATYDKLVTVPGAGEVLTFQDHVDGAEAAQAAGDLNTAYERWMRAQTASDATDMAYERVAEILVHYGRVNITVKASYSGPKELEPLDAPMDPAKREVITRAQKAVAKGAYEGLLPLGRYTLDGTAVEVVGGAEVTVVAKASDVRVK